MAIIATDFEFCRNIYRNTLLH